MIKSVLRTLAVLSIAALTLGACSSEEDTDAPASGVTLTFGDQVKGLQVLAEASDAFAGADYGIEWAQFQGAAPLFEAVKGGSVDTGYAADLPTLQAISAGVPIKSVAAFKSDGNGNVIIAREGSGVNSVADLKGKTVTVSSAKGSIAEYLLVRALEEAGLSYSDVTIQYLLPTDAQAAFVSGNIDVWATFGIFGNIGLSRGGTLLVDGTGGRTTGIGILSATDAALADPAKKTALTDAIARLDKAVEWGQDHPDLWAQAIAKANNTPVETAEVLVQQGNKSTTALTPDVVADIQVVADTMHGVGSLQPNVDVAATSDPSVYPVR
ncbi:MULTISPECIES: ABC transporter substrate-binding protein [Nocardiaceae]|uniref:ABC transporter substrate-binding protein n=1 Tax=Nocardiaceae TaxID=85025 RepID=UPI00050C5447|nr:MULTISPECIES: ABC transporter substrate-binding protein [Rhodococcus]